MDGASASALVINTDDSDDSSNEGDDSKWSNTSKKKVESLLGKGFFKHPRRGIKLESLQSKEFKHPRRKCGICGCKLKFS